MIFAFNYATPSVFESDPERSLLGLTAERPVRFKGRILREIPLVRFALRAFGEALWSWRGGDSWHEIDPLVTVHPDRLFLEGFSADLSVYVRLGLESDLFEPEGDVQTGTTSVDFTAWMWGALGEMRSSRRTELAIDPAGFQVTTAGAGGRSEPEVELPEAFLRGLLELQAAMTLPGIRLVVRPVDLLAPIRFLRYSKGRVTPRALRYEFEPDQPVRIVLEPWEKSFTLQDTVHGYDAPRKVRTWGRDRLRLLESLLPFADSVHVFLKGRGLPHFYLVKLPSMSFLIGLSGWSARNFQEPGFSLLSPPGEGDPGDILLELREKFSLREPIPALDRLVRRGQALYDPDRKEYRWREIFPVPLEEARLYPPDTRQARVPLLLGQTELSECLVQESRKVRRFKTPEGKVEREVVYRDWRVRGKVEQRAVEAVINERGRAIFATCECPFFQENLLQKGPCEHILALIEKSAELRVDQASSVEAPVGESDEDAV